MILMPDAVIFGIGAETGCVFNFDDVCYWSSRRIVVESC